MWNFKVVYLILLILSVSVALYGLFLINSAQNISEYPEFEHYFFDFYFFDENDSSVDLSTAQFTYHFEEDEVHLGFRPNKNLKKIVINTPKRIVRDVRAKIIEPDKEIPLNIILPENKNYEGRITILFQEENKGNWTHIYFNIDLSPNARFTINKNSIWGDTAHIYLNFGTEFECSREDCAFNLQNVGFTRRDTDPIRTVRLRFINQNSVNDPEYQFDIIAHSTKIINSKNFRISFGSSILGGSIFALFAIIIAFYQSWKGGHPKLKDKEVKLAIKKEIFKSLKKELSKISKKIKLESNISKRLNKIGKEIRISSFDMTILTSIFFFIALYISLADPGTLQILKENPYALIGFFYLLIPIIAMIFSILPYVSSIIFSNNRLINKVDSLAYIWGSIMFVVEIWLVLFILFLIEKFSLVPKNLIPLITYIIAGISFILAICFTLGYIKPKLIEYFKKEYSIIIK